LPLGGAVHGGRGVFHIPQRLRDAHSYTRRQSRTLESAMFFGKLLPREGNFYEMFQQHADRIVEAARAFTQLVTHYNDPHLREQYNRDVDNAERAADRVTHEVNKMVHKTFITPIDRDQIHTLINTMDDVADLIQDTAETMALYDVHH